MNLTLNLKTSIRAPLLALGLITLTLPSLALADYEAGVNAAFEGDYDLAYTEFTIAAEGGLDLAQYNLGILYFFGQGVDQDYAEAFKWTEAAANQGHVAAMFNLGSLYFSGQGTSADEDMAAELYARSARAGHPDAAITLARMYQEGESSIEKDEVLAHAWASIAIANEHTEGASVRSEIEEQLSESQLSEARRMFARWQIQ